MTDSLSLRRKQRTSGVVNFIKIPFLSFLAATQNSPLSLIIQTCLKDQNTRILINLIYIHFIDVTAAIFLFLCVPRFELLLVITAPHLIFPGISHPIFLSWEILHSRLVFSVTRLCTGRRTLDTVRQDRADNTRVGFVHRHRKCSTAFDASVLP